MPVGGGGLLSGIASAVKAQRAGDARRTRSSPRRARRSRASLRGEPPSPSSTARRSSTARARRWCWPRCGRALRELADDAVVGLARGDRRGRAPARRAGARDRRGRGRARARGRAARARRPASSASSRAGTSTRHRLTEILAGRVRTSRRAGAAAGAAARTRARRRTRRRRRRSRPPRSRRRPRRSRAGSWPTSRARGSRCRRSRGGWP